MKVVSLIAESFNRHDLAGWFPKLPHDAEFSRFHAQTAFDLAPAKCSASALWAMESGAVRGEKLPRPGGRWFDRSTVYLGDLVRQRIISSSWPNYVNARRFDPEANIRKDRRGEPGVETLRKFLAAEFYSGRSSI